MRVPLSPRVVFRRKPRATRPREPARCLASVHGSHSGPCGSCQRPPLTLHCKSHMKPGGDAKGVPTNDKRKQVQTELQGGALSPDRPSQDHGGLPQTLGGPAGLQAPSRAPCPEERAASNSRGLEAQRLHQLHSPHCLPAPCCAPPLAQGTMPCPTPALPPLLQPTPPDGPGPWPCSTGTASLRCHPRPRSPSLPRAAERSRALGEPAQLAGTYSRPQGPVSGWVRLNLSVPQRGWGETVSPGAGLGPLGWVRNP